VRVGPILGLMGTLIPLAPALEALANNDTAELANQLEIAFSVTVVGLLIGGLAFTISIFRDRFYSQDISDLEYLLELLEGSGKRLRGGGGVRRAAGGKQAAAEEDAGLSDESIAAEGIAAERAVLADDGAGMLPDLAAEAELQAVHIEDADVVGGRGLDTAAAAQRDGDPPADEADLVGAETAVIDPIQAGKDEPPPRTRRRKKESPS
jgi:hypothetical protein